MVGNDAVALFIVNADGKIIFDVVTENIVAEKRATVVASQNAHDRRRQIDLADHSGDTFGAQTGRTEEQRRHAVFIDRHQFRPT